MKKFLIVSAISMMIAAPAFAEGQTGEKKDMPCTSVSSTKNSNQGVSTQSTDEEKAAPAGSAGSARGEKK